MSSFKSKSYNHEAITKSKRHDPKRSFNGKSYQKIKHHLTSPDDTPIHSSLFHTESENPENETDSSGGIIEQLQDLTKNHKTAEDSMQIIYHVWEEDELDNVFALFDAAKNSKDSDNKVKIKHDNEHLVFEFKEQQVKIKFDKNLLHHIHSYCHGPIDTVGKLNYHSRNLGPVDSPEEITYLTDTPGPIDTIMELLYNVRNEGQVDTVFEWYRLVRNSGDISSRDEIQYNNQNLGPQDTKGEYMRRSKNVGAVDTPDERGFYGLNQQNQNPNANNSGPIDTQDEVNARGKKTASPSPFDTNYKPY